MAQRPFNGVLLADQGAAGVAGSGRVLLLNDLNGDGNTDAPGERSVFFDGSNASGLAAPTENVFTVHQARDGSVFIGDGQTDTVYHLLDRNGDGDANDVGEATVWLTSDAAGGYSLITPNGITQGADGSIYIANAGTSATPQDAIYRTLDLNGDGDAMDAGEKSVWLNLQDAAQTTSPTTLNRPVPYEVEFTTDNVAYLIDPNGGPPLIRRIEDSNGDHVITQNEVTTFISDAVNNYGASIDFSLEDQGQSVLTWEWVDNSPSDGKFSLHRLTDLDGSGTINAPNEAVEVWNSTLLPAGYTAVAGFSVASDAQGRVALTSNGSAASTDNVFLLEDKNGDGLYTSAGETSVLASAATGDVLLYRPRAVEFYTDPTPIITSNGGETTAAISVEENTVAVTTVLASDGNTQSSDLRYSIAGGADANSFTINSVTGALSFQNTPNYENPQEAGRDNVYDVTVLASDGVLTDWQTLAITVTDAIETSPTPMPTGPSNGPDRLTGTSGSETVNSGAGDDVIDGGSGSDTILGGDGSDQIVSRPGAGETVLLFGGNGTSDPNDAGDVIRVSSAGGGDVFANGGDDTVEFTASGIANIFGGFGDDRIRVANDADNGVTGGQGGDTITIVGNGDNLVYGGTGPSDPNDASDTIAITGNGNNIIFSNGGDDVVSIIGAGNNIAFAGFGNDTLRGGSGSDTFIGGPGDNVYTGGAGADTFVISAGARDIVTDFNFSAGDRLNIQEQSYFVTTASDGSAALVFAEGVLILQGVTQAEVGSNYFA